MTVVNERELKSFVLRPFKKSKDAVKSPFRYPGGKFYALKYILPFIETVPHDEYREPFVGGGSVFFSKKKVKYNWINDLETEMIDVYKCIADPYMSEQLIDLITNEVANRERHAAVKNIQPKTELEAVFKTYYLNRTSYCGIIHMPAWGYQEGKSSPPENWQHFVRETRPKLSGVRMTDFDFEKVIKAEPSGSTVLMYLDPPYFHADQKRAYTKSFEISDHERLADVLQVTDYHFCLSYDDCDEVRELYSWANIFERKWLYNTANKRGVTRMVGNELIITNYDLQEINLFSNL